MKKFAIVLVCVMLVTSFTGCTKKVAPTTSGPAVQTQAEKIAEIDLLATTTIYFDGVRPSYIEPRSDLPKALPLKIKGSVPYIGMAMARMTSQVQTGWVSASAERCKQYGYKFEFTDAGGSTEKQRANFDTMVTKGVDVILINPLDPVSNEMDVERAVAKGVAVIGYGIPFFPTADVITCFGQQSYECGFALGQKAAVALEGESVKVGLIISRYGQSSLESTTNGFVAGLIHDRFAQMGKPFASKEDAMLYGYKKYVEFRKKGKLNVPDADIDIVASGEGQLTASVTMKVTEDMFTAHPDINLLYVGTDVEGEGTVTALDLLGIPYGVGKKLKLVFGGGATESSMNLLGEGKLVATVDFPPVDVAYPMVDLIHAILSENFDANNLPISTYNPIVLLTKDNVDQYQVKGQYWPKSTLPATFRPISIDDLNK